MSSDIEFVDGLRVYAPNDKAPDFIVANGEIEIEAMKAWCAQRSGKVRIVIKRSQGGKLYAAVDSYKRDAAPAPKPKPAPQPEPGGFVDDDLDGIPF